MAAWFSSNHEIEFSNVGTVFWNSCLMTASWLNLKLLMTIKKVFKNKKINKIKQKLKFLG